MIKAIKRMTCFYIMSCFYYILMSLKEVIEKNVTEEKCLLCIFYKNLSGVDILKKS